MNQVKGEQRTVNDFFFGVGRMVNNLLCNISHRLCEENIKGLSS